MKYIGILATVFVITSCAVSQEIVLPSGEKGFTVDCGTYEGNSWSACYKKAGEMCPSGYDILEKSEEEDKSIVANQFSLQTLDDDKRTLIIKCKQSDIDLCFDATYNPSQYIRQELTNRRIDCELPSLKARVAEKRQKQIDKEQALIELRDTLERIGDRRSYKGTNNLEPTTLQQGRVLLKREYVEGTSKVCVYDRFGKVHIITHANRYTPCKPAVSID